MYVNRETGTCSGISVRSRLETNSDDRPLDRVREAGSRRRLDRLRRRKASRRPAASVTAPGQQRHVRQEEAATRLGHSLRRYVQDVRPTTSHFSVALSTRLDDTRGRQRDSSSGSATSTFVTLRRTHTPTTSTSTTIVVTFVHHGTAQLLKLSSNITLCLGDSHQPSHRTTKTDLHTPLSQVYQLNDCIQSTLHSY